MRITLTSGAGSLAHISGKLLELVLFFFGCDALIVVVNVCVVIVGVANGSDLIMALIVVVGGVW